MRTRNLLDKTKTTLLLNDEDFELFCKNRGLYLTDSTTKFDVYRNFGTEHIKERVAEEASLPVWDEPKVETPSNEQYKWEQQRIDFGVLPENTRRRHKEF